METNTALKAEIKKRYEAVLSKTWSDDFKKKEKQFLTAFGKAIIGFETAKEAEAKAIKQLQRQNETLLNAKKAIIAISDIYNNKDEMDISKTFLRMIAITEINPEIKSFYQKLSQQK